MFCPDCNYSVQVTDNYCSSCGAKLEILSPKMNRDPEYARVLQKSSSSPFTNPVFVIGVVYLGLTLFWSSLTFLFLKLDNISRFFSRMSAVNAQVAVVSELAVAVLCIVFVKNTRYRIILACLLVLSLILRFLWIYYFTVQNPWGILKTNSY